MAQRSWRASTRLKNNNNNPYFFLLFYSPCAQAKPTSNEKINNSNLLLCHIDVIKQQQNQHSNPNQNTRITMVKFLKNMEELGALNAASGDKLVVIDFTASW